MPRVDGDNAPPTPVVASTRRRFLKGGLSVAPVLLTLHSRPVLAWQCQSPSAFCSGNASHPQKVADEGCKTIAYWQTCSSYPSTCGFTKTTLFKNVYSCSDTTLGSKTVDTVLKNGDDVPEIHARGTPEHRQFFGRGPMFVEGRSERNVDRLL